MKSTPTRFTVKDGQGSHTWRFQYQQGVYNCGGNLKRPRRINGWLLTTHDDQERFCEGNWQDFVPFVRLIASNYGVETTIS